MKVTIKDKASLSKILPEQLREYLETNEWEMVYESIKDEVVTGTHWEKYNGETHQWAHVHLLHENHWPDYTMRMAENLMEIEKYTDQSQLNIYADITDLPIMVLPSRVYKEVMETE